MGVEYAIEYAKGHHNPPHTGLTPPTDAGEWPIILTACVVGNTWPVTPCADDFFCTPPKKPDDCRWYGMPLKPTYTEHLSAVSKTNFLAVNPTAMHFHEIVFDQDAQLLPLAIVWFSVVP